MDKGSKRRNNKKAATVFYHAHRHVFLYAIITHYLLNEKEATCSSRLGNLFAKIYSEWAKIIRVIK